MATASEPPPPPAWEATSYVGNNDGTLASATDVERPLGDAAIPPNATDSTAPPLQLEVAEALERTPAETTWARTRAESAMSVQEQGDEVSSLIAERSPITPPL